MCEKDLDEWRGEFVGSLGVGYDMCARKDRCEEHWGRAGVRKAGGDCIELRSQGPWWGLRPWRAGTSSKNCSHTGIAATTGHATRN